MTNSWSAIKKEKKGTITLYWYESRPFIYKDIRGKMQGIEAEILEGFRDYLKEKHNITVRIIWKESTSFANVYSTIRDQKNKASFGASAFSITPERSLEVNFSSSYMSDISVLISSRNLPIVKNPGEFQNVFSHLTALTIKGTTYESELLKLKNKYNLPFNIKYIPSSENILRTIAKTDNTFGYIDLPVYMMMFANNPGIQVNRQNLLPVKRDGYALILPKSSDWTVPLEEYFSDKGFHALLENIIARYIDIDLYRFIESFFKQANDEVSILTKEKEIQNRDLAGKEEKIANERLARNILVGLVILSFILLAAIFILYTKRSQQKRKIEAQGKSIALKNEQLIKRNIHLVTLDEEKNNLIKILAHDMRTPINHIQGLANVFLLTNKAVAEDQQAIIKEIKEASVRLSKMITSILDVDALDNKRIKLQTQDVMISLLVEQVVRSFQAQASKKNINLSFTSLDTQTIMKGDPLFLTQIFENLISNALKFSEREKEVSVQVKNVGAKVLVSVADQGPGLTPEDCLLLFKKFQRLSARPTAGEGSIGLGLSIVKKYVELMNGLVWCESELHKGSTFFVEFDIS